jgi:hypothetical protein
MKNWSSMENVIWVLLSLLVVIVLKQLLHTFKYKTDRYYRYQADQADQYKEFKRSAARLGGMNPRSGGYYLRKLTRDLAGKR